MPNHSTPCTGQNHPPIQGSLCNHTGKHVRAWQGYVAGRSPLRRCARLRASKATKPIEVKGNEFSRIGHKASAPNPPQLSCVESAAYLTKRACFSTEANGPSDRRVRRSANLLCSAFGASRGALDQSRNVLWNHHKLLAGGWTGRKNSQLGGRIEDVLYNRLLRLLP